MSHIALSCSGISKTFTRSVVPSSHLQDHVLRWRTHARKLRMTALQDVSFQLRKGEWVGLYGSNGSGKTTLLRILAGLMVPDAGTVRRQGSMAYFLDLGAGFHPERTARENLYFHGLLYGMTPKRIKELTPQVIAFAGIEAHADMPFKCYSTGMRMRLAFSAIAHIESDIFLWDEVVAVGDAGFQRKCLEYLRALKASGKSAIVVAHNLAYLEDICDRIVHLEQGRIVGDRPVLPPEVTFAFPSLPLAQAVA